MLEKSSLTKKKIKDIVKEKYDLSVDSVEKINRGTANLFLLITDKGEKLVLKEFQSKYTKDEIDKEISIINFLMAKKMPVPKYIELKNNDYSFLFDGHVVIMQEYIEGYTMEKNTGDSSQTLESAKYLGKMVSALEDYNHEVSFKPEGWFGTNFDSAIEKYKNMLNTIKEDDKNKDIIIKDINDKIDMLNQLKNVDFSDINKVSIKYTHGDYSVMQFIYQDNKIKAIIDFVAACDMPIIWEIIRSYSYIDKECLDGKFNVDNFIDYVKEYLKYSKLNKYDLEYMPYVYLLQLLKSNFGYKQYIENGDLDLLEFGILRTNICRYLIQSSKEISKRLLEEIEF